MNHEKESEIAASIGGNARYSADTRGEKEREREREEKEARIEYGVSCSTGGGSIARA